MAEAVLSFAAEKLSNLLIQKAVFLHGVKGEVEWVKDELKSMECFLKDAAKKQSNKESIRKWISDIREVAHDAEDAIEMFVLNVEGDRGPLQRFSRFPYRMYHRNKVGEKIESIRKRLEDIGDRRRSYGIEALGDPQREESGSQLEVESRRRLDYWQDDKYAVGLKKDVELLLGKAILEKSEGLSVATISGMGGIGKSTLARKIYNHLNVVNMFECRVWAVVSSEFTPEGIMKNILLQLGISSERLKQLESYDNRLDRREKLKKELHQRLSGKRYFIVLDDVWEREDWESLSSAFPDADKGSRLLLTSRNQVLTKDDGYVHNMKILEENESWELFLRKAFCNSTNGECPEELKNIGEEILKKCGGLPLAISVVGGLLAKKTRSTSGWKEVLEEMRSGLDGDIDTISAILELSYQNLPTKLKACFLCLGLFKEDAIIKAKELVHIWVAQGLVPQEVLGNGKKMEDVARVYLNELISRNMVQVQEMEYERVKSCHMHDLLHDLSIRKAKEEIDLEVVREEGNSHHQSLHKRRHRAIYFKRSSFIYNTNRNQYLRSLFIHGGESRDIVGGPSSYWKSFELLRVLRFGNAMLDDLPEAIGLLIGLRYLKIVGIHRRRRNFRGRIFKQWFPPSWAKLKNLEVLDLRGCDYTIIDKVVVEMDSLRHLYSDRWISEVPLKNIRKLETLSLLEVNDWNAWQIEGMAGVSKLGIHLSSMSDASRLNRYLAALGNLVCLTLAGSYTVSPFNMEWLGALHRITHLKLEAFFNMERLPGDFPPSLSHLTLNKVLLTEDPMRVLERLPKLLHLKLRDAYQGEKMVVSRGGFPCLKVLSLEDMFELRNLEIGEGAMPELSQFIIRRCPKLDIENVPEHVKSAMTDAAH